MCIPNITQTDDPSFFVNNYGIDIGIHLFKLHICGIFSPNHQSYYETVLAVEPKLTI
jgi:hypothetical protein